MANDIFLTTPIYYVNDAPHIGHAYTTILADVLNRYHRLFGANTFFLTGTDEHGQKVQNSAEKRGVSAQAHCDEYVERFRAIWNELNVHPDFFIRTTMDFHKKVVQDCLQELYDKGEIYLGEYEGWYSESEEIFYTEDELVDGKSPVGKPVTKVSEKNYFFRMSHYHQALVSYVEENADFIQPKGKRSEVIGFLKQPLGDLCISRPKSRLTWGIELPFDSEFVTYVWFDALLNYVSAIGYKQKNERTHLFDTYWRCATHLIGKDILMTHSVYWPTMLMALGLPLPRTIFAHGWWLNEDAKKMSKSEGSVVAPLDMKNIVGVDGLRYFLIRAMNPAHDGAFSQELVVTRLNAELSNNLGNLLNRTTGLVVKYFDGELPEVKNEADETKALHKHAISVAEEVRSDIIHLSPHKAIERIIDLLTETNKYLDVFEPWKTLKTGETERGGECLYSAIEVLRIAGILLSPVMPKKSVELLRRLGYGGEPQFDDAKRWGVLPSGTKVEKAEALFPRIELPQ